MRVTTFSTISSVDAADWNSFVGPGGFYASHAWLRGQETAEWAEPSYVLAGDEAGPAAAAVSWRLTGNVYSLPDIATDEDGLLLVGGRTGYHNELLVRDGAGGGSSFGPVLAELARAAGTGGRRWLLFDYLDTASLQALGRIARVAYLLREGAAVLENPGGTLDSYLASFCRRRRQKMVHEMRVFDAAGYRVELLRLSECVPDLAGIMAATMRKYGTEVPEAGIRAFLDAQAACVDEESVVFAGIDESGRMVGCCLYFVWRDTMYARVAGFDYPHLRDAFEYFNLVYYHPLRYLGSRGLRRLHLGVDSLHAKWRRGADLYPTWAALVDVSTILDDGPPGLSELQPTADEAVRDQIRHMTRAPLSSVWFPSIECRDLVDVHDR